MSANFSDLQSVNTANDTDQMMLRLDNGAIGPDGFARIEISKLNNVFTATLTASDAKVKQMSASWDASYTLVNANSSVFTLVNSNSAQWDAAYAAVTGSDYNFGNKVFDYVAINGPYDARNVPIFRIDRDSITTADMVQIIPSVASSMFRITTAGSVGINTNENYTFASGEALHVEGSQRIIVQQGTALTVNGDVVVNGSLSALSATYISTIITTTSAISISSNGPGPALFVNQYDVGSTQNIAQFKSDAATITMAGDGDITGFNDLSGSGKVVVGSNNIITNATSYALGSNNRDSNLANVYIFGSSITAPSANYTYVQNLSTAGLIAANSVAAGGKTSSDWNNTYTTVNAQSAANASVYSTVNNTSGYWTSIFNVVSATNTSALTAAGTATNINAALIAKGTGATLAQIPNNLTTGGSARGMYATDLQKSRNNAGLVAAGNYSTIGGGDSNWADGEASTVAGGVFNWATGIYSAIAGGLDNAATGQSATIAGGNDNLASGSASTVAGGDVNVASGNFSTAAGGASNTASGENSVVGGGYSNNASNYHTTIAGGYNNTASGSASISCGGFNNIASASYATIAGGALNTTSSFASFVGGGISNQASNVTSLVAGGNENTASGLASTVGGGYNNEASGSYSTIAGGTGSTATGTHAIVAGGGANDASGDYSFIGGGVGNVASGYFSSILGNQNNIASGDYSVVIGEICYATGKHSTSLGFRTSATNYGELAFGTGAFNDTGDNKSSTFLSRTTTNASGSAVAYLDGSSANEEIALPNSSTYAYTATIVGLSSHENTSGLHYVLRGLAKCNSSGVVTLYNTSTDLASKVPTSLNAAVSASGNKLRVVVYSPSTNIHYWHARIQAEYLKF